MMSVYDKAHELAAAIKESEEFQEYQRLKDLAYEDGTNRALLDEYKRLQYHMQARIASGAPMDESELTRMQQIGSLLQFNPDAGAYLLAEFRFQRTLADIYKILAEVAGIDLEKLIPSP